MKGLLSGTNKFPGILLMRKRQRGDNLVSGKKPRKSWEKSIAKGKVRILASEEFCMEAADAGELRPEPERPISYEGDKVIVTLKFKETVAMDGWAMVRLVDGRAAVHGYSLSVGVDVLLCSNSKLAAVVTIESQASSPDVGGLVAEVRQSHPVSTESGESSGLPEKSLNSGEAQGCTLEFRSYRKGSADSGPRFDAVNGESARKRTFRIEIGGENGTAPQQDIQKRKRDEEIAGGSSQGSQAGEDEELSGSGEDGEDEEDEVKSGDNAVQHDQVDMDVDDLLDNGRDKKKPRLKELRSPLNTTVIPDTWWVVANSIVQQCIVKGSSKDLGVPQQCESSGQNYRPPVVAVCGPKNTGKSTFTRFLLNFLLNSHEDVGYLDTDVGQPEFTVPGCLSLHIVKEPIFGSPVLHLRNPERSFFYGDVSPKGDPEMYSRSVGALYDYFQRKYGSTKAGPDQDNHRDSSRIPLVINTHGWIKGIGYDVLVDILRHTSPTHVVQFTCKAENKNLPAGKFWETSGDVGQTEVLYIESALEGDNRPLVRVKMASDHLRAARIMAYFRLCFSEQSLPYPYREDKLFAQTALSLVSHAPYQVRLSALKIWHLHCQVPERESLYSINGALVGLGVSSTATAWNMDKALHRALPLLCVGLGIVRGIDAEKGILYLITPLPMEVVQSVDTLLQGRVEIPVPLLQGKGYMSPYLCHNSVAIEGTGSVAMTPYKKFSK